MKTVLLVLGALAVGTVAKAQPITFDFGSATGNLGTSHTYSAAGYSIVATGYDAFGNLTDLYGKNDGGDEVGLGLANDPTGDNEIHFQSGFIQLDMLGLHNKLDPASIFVSMNSATDGEEWAVYGSNVRGSYTACCVQQLLIGSTETMQHVRPSFAYGVYDFVAINHTPGTHDNVLLHTFTTTIPEPSTWAMMLTAFFGFGAVLRRRRAAASVTSWA